MNPDFGERVRTARRHFLQPTDTGNPAYFHKVVDCQLACPAHTPVPEYIRLIAQGRYTDAYMVNWASNVFPGILGRTCDRPCEPACRRSRVEVNDGAPPEPVAICRLKRVAADHKGEIAARLPDIAPPNGKRIVCVGAGPASLTVARDLLPLGYAVTVYDGEQKAGGFIRSQIPRFRLPDTVIDEETGYILDMGVDFRSGQPIASMKALLADGFDAVFVGCGAPRGRNLDLPGRQDIRENIHIGIDWLASVSFGHITSIGRRVIVLGGGNTAMDCCRSSRRLGGTDVKVVVRSGFDEMKASPWEKEDAQHEGIPIINCHVPKSFEQVDGKLTGMTFEVVKSIRDANGKRSLIPTGDPDVLIECEAVLIAVGQENAFPWIEVDCAIAFDQWGLPVLDKESFQSSLPHVFFGGDSAFGPKNIITAVAHGHEAAVSIDRLQTPVFVMSDLDIGMNQRLCEPLVWQEGRDYDRGKVMTAAELEAGKDFGRYKDVDGDGIGWRTLPGTHPTKGSYFTRGTTRDPYARYSERGPDYTYNVERLLTKFKTAAKLVPQPVVRAAKRKSRLGVIFFGSTSPAMHEALDVMTEQGIHLDAMRLCAFPFPDSVAEFIAAHKLVYVVEQNRDAQMRQLLVNELGVDPARLVPVLHFDGTPITARFITRRISEHVQQAAVAGPKRPTARGAAKTVSEAA